MHKIIILFFTVSLAFAGCEKMQDKTEVKQAPKELSGGEQSQDNKLNQMREGMTQDGTMEETQKLVKEADEAYDKFKKDKSAMVKEEMIRKNLNAGNYLMYYAPVPPREKYPPALKHYRRVLTIDPSNQEADTNKAKIEEIYKLMGRPVPETEL